MATINFYLDKPDKKGLAPIHLRINCNGKQLKVATGEKISPNDFDKETQKIRSTVENHLTINHYLAYLKNRADNLLHKSLKKIHLLKDIKGQLTDFITAYKTVNRVSIVEEQIPLYGQSFTFLDLFAGAGGFSEGFLQANYNNKYFDFRLASDINDNCALTHIVRYNHQLGLDAAFLCQDITEPDFLNNLLQKIEGKTIDVVCGGPPCQSFSLAGKRKKFDKKDDLFTHYLQVIKTLKPKYFIMENVRGILTKEKGAIKELIIKQINSIVDTNALPKVISFAKKLKTNNQADVFLLDCLVQKIQMEQYSEKNASEARKDFIQTIASKFRIITPKIVDYQTSKTDQRINTIRHGFNLLARNKEWHQLRSAIIKEKDFCNIDSDYFVDAFNQFLAELDMNKVIKKIEHAFEELPIPEAHQKTCQDIITALKLYALNFDDSLLFMEQFCDETQLAALPQLKKDIRLYRINAPFVANASDYGVPQNRERVLFIGCRKDQVFIEKIPATVSPENKVSIFEALYDLDFLGNNETAHHYEKINLKQQYNGSSSKMKKLLKKRLVDGTPEQEKGKTFAEWSKKGRLNTTNQRVMPPFYVNNFEALKKDRKIYDVLHNHQTSNQSEKVLQRLAVILEAGNYKAAQNKLAEKGLSSKKRNYNVLKPDKQSPTVMTIADDYIHYNTPRALTVREMARLQSFDDSFVFQGKRSTGGNKRKSEVPQYTLVGNAVPPLLARAIGMEILKHIK